MLILFAEALSPQCTTRRQPVGCLCSHISEQLRLKDHIWIAALSEGHCFVPKGQVIYNVAGGVHEIALVVFAPVRLSLVPAW
jgi:hypothetical protein